MSKEDVGRHRREQGGREPARARDRRQPSASLRGGGGSVPGGSVRQGSAQAHGVCDTVCVTQCVCTHLAGALAASGENRTPAVRDGACLAPAAAEALHRERSMGFRTRKALFWNKKGAVLEQERHCFRTRKPRLSLRSYLFRQAERCNLELAALALVRGQAAQARDSVMPVRYRSRLCRPWER